jgi:hypothetical protein
MCKSGSSFLCVHRSIIITSQSSDSCSILLDAKKRIPEVYMMMQGESGVGGTDSMSTSAMLLLADFLPRATTSQKFRILDD